MTDSKINALFCSMVNVSVNVVKFCFTIGKYVVNNYMASNTFTSHHIYS